MLFKIICYVAFPVFLALMWIRCPIEPITVDVQPFLKFPDERFNIVQVKESNKITLGTGPESIQFDKLGNLYTGLLDGRILKIHRNEHRNIGEGKVEVILDGLKGIENQRSDEYSKGRPLGMRLCEKQNHLYVVDSYYGLYSIDLNSYEVNFLVYSHRAMPTMKFVNDFTLSENCDTVYLTDSSSKFPLHTLPLEFVEGTCNGRIFKYEISKNKLSTFAEGLCMPNGIQLTLNESQLIVSETVRYNVLFFDISSRKIVKRTMLPGSPDNIRPSKQAGHYWVACPVYRTKLTDIITSQRWLRKLAASIASPKMLYKFTKRGTGMAFKINENGDIVSTIFDENGSHGYAISEVNEYADNELWCGSFHTNFISKIYVESSKQFFT